MGNAHGKEISKHPRDRRQHAGGADQSSGAERRQSLRQDRSVQPAGLGQRPPGARRDRGGRKIRRAEARSDRDRGDQRQHRHWPCHGLRRQGLPAGGDHGGAVQRRAAQADALSRREGHRHARGRAWCRHGQQGSRACQGPWLVHDPAVRERSQSRLSIRERPRARSSTISPASGWTIGSRAMAPAER